MKLSQLQYFQAACRHGSITAAAEHLHLSQPSVSAAIRELETEFGVTLLNRKYRGFTLTHEGMVLLEQINQLLDHADRVQTVMQELAQQQRPLRLGVPPMIGSLILPGVFRDFLAQNPGFELNITEGGRQELLRLLGEGHLDLMFLPHDKPVDAAFQSIPVMLLETVWCAKASHRLAQRQYIRLEELEGEPLVLFKKNFFQTERILQAFHAKNMTPQVLMYTAQLSTVRRLIHSGVATGFLYRALAASEAALTSISLDPPMRTDVSLIWRTGIHPFREMTRFINYVQSIDTH